MLRKISAVCCLGVLSFVLAGCAESGATVDKVDTATPAAETTTDPAKDVAPDSAKEHAEETAAEPAKGQ